MSSPKIIAVIGATGSQGGGLAHAILNDPTHEFACRAISRKPGADPARVLMIEGAELVQADLDDVEKSDALHSRGAYGAFCVTNFWEHFSAEKELAQARNLADAARAAGVRHVVWSTLEDTRKYMDPSDTRMPMLQERFRVPHFDAKAEANEFLQRFASDVHAHVILLGQPLRVRAWPEKRADDGRPTVGRFPWVTNPWLALRLRTLGRWRLAFSRRAIVFSARISVLRQNLSPSRRWVRASRAALDCGPIVYNDVSADAYRAFGFPGADELGNMFQVYRDFAEPFNASRDPKLARELNPEMLSYKAFLEKYKARIPM